MWTEKVLNPVQLIANFLIASLCFFFFIFIFIFSSVNLNWKKNTLNYKVSSDPVSLKYALPALQSSLLRHNIFQFEGLFLTMFVTFSIPSVKWKFDKLSVEYSEVYLHTSIPM